jgi:putative membrane protein
MLFAEGIEQLGVHSGWPFGTYSYDRSLGFAIASVPIIVPFAWLFLAYPTLIAARVVAKSWAFLYGALGLVAWDYFLDPEMVAAGRWHWKLVGPHTPFAPGIPLSNSAGWLFSGMGLMAILNALLPRERRKGGASTILPEAVLLWTGFAGVVGNIFYFHRTGVGVIGGLLFIALYAPYIYITRYSRPDLQ